VKPWIQRWEYTEVWQSWDDDETFDKGPIPILNEYGQAGWELVIMFEDEDGRTMYLKRPIAD
jgi:hypothetical protein